MGSHSIITVDTVLICELKTIFFVLHCTNNEEAATRRLSEFSVQGGIVHGCWGANHDGVCTIAGFYINHTEGFCNHIEGGCTVHIGFYHVVGHCSGHLEG